MEKWTAEKLKRFAPGARDDYIAALVEGWDAMIVSGINTPLRVCHFLAQAAHETGDFKIVRENCNWTLENMCALWPARFKKSDPVFLAKFAACRGDDAAERKAELAYGARTRTDLGNCEDGDGWHYRGGGIFQGTGRNWYRETGQAIGVDLEGEPSLIEDPRISLAAAIWYWKRYDLNRFADRNYGRAVGNQINRGSPFSKHEPIGWKERARAFDRAWAVFGDGKLPSPLDLGLGAYGPDVESIQVRLRELGYQPGAADGVFGREMSRAVAAFKHDCRERGVDVEEGETVGPLTRSALATADRISRPEREAMTAKDLIAAGSTEAKAGVDAQKLGTLLLLGGGGAGGVKMTSGTEPMRLADTAPQANPAQVLEQTAGWVPQAKQQLIPIMEALNWAITHWLWIVIIVAGLWMYVKGGGVLKARLDAARRGLNLSK